MKTLIIYYSLNGNTKFIAQTIANELQADLLELRTIKAFPSSGFMKYFIGGKSVTLKERPKLANDSIDLTAYDTIIIGTPVWAGKYASPFNTFIDQYKFTGKNVALFACHGGGGTKNCFDMFKKALSGNDLIGETAFIEPLRKNKEENAKKAIKWARNLSV